MHPSQISHLLFAAVLCSAFARSLAADVSIETKMGSSDVELFTPLQPAETRALQDAIERYSRFMDLPVTASYT